MPTPIGVPEPPLGEDVVDLMLACHVRIRHFLGVARAVGREEAVSAGDLRDACDRTRRYFVEALPRHVADENESVLPRLRGRSASLDAALSAMRAEHADHAPLVDELVRLLDAVALEPASPARRASVSRCAESLTAELERHLAAEETHVFPAMRALLSDAERTQILAELRARRRAQSPAQERVLVTRPETDAIPPDGPAPDAATRPARRAALRALRQRRHIEWAHGQIPTERLVAADEWYALASAIGDVPVREDGAPLRLALKARWRRLVA